MDDRARWNVLAVAACAGAVGVGLGISFVISRIPMPDFVENMLDIGLWFTIGASMVGVWSSRRDWSRRPGGALTRTAWQARNLCARGLEGSLRPEELRDAWPRELRGDPFHDRVLADLEDAIAHLREGFPPGKAGVEAWRNSRPYRLLYLDWLLAGAGHPGAELLRCRESVIARGLASEAAVASDARACIAGSP